MVHGPLRIAKGGGRGETRVLPDTANGGRVCGAVRATMVVQFAMGAMVLGQFGRGFGAAACFRMWWFAQLKLLGLLLELRQCRGVMWSRYELTELGLCALGLGGCDAVISTPLYSHLGNESVRKVDFYGLTIALTKT